MWCVLSADSGDRRVVSQGSSLQAHTDWGPVYRMTVHPWWHEFDGWTIGTGSATLVFEFCAPGARPRSSGPIVLGRMDEGIAGTQVFRRHL